MDSFFRFNSTLECILDSTALTSYILWEWVFIELGGGFLGLRFQGFRTNGLIHQKCSYFKVLCVQTRHQINKVCFTHVEFILSRRLIQELIISLVSYGSHAWRHFLSSAVSPSFLPSYHCFSSWTWVCWKRLRLKRESYSWVVLIWRGSHPIVL
jgi:hypothetical protein